VLTAALASAALLAGLAGAWSPCGFSMVETIAPGAVGRVRATLAAALAFALGALAGGAATFGGLALAGERLGTGGALAAALAAGALLVAAAGDAAGRRIVPQVRRQVPESWRRIMPLPLASGLYGVLLGLGFTTFVLSFATYALALACLALGEPGAGLAVGLAFGMGRALPVVVLAPLQDRDAGLRAATTMAERPAVLHGLRAAAAAALAVAVAALALDGAPAAAQATQFQAVGTDPGASDAAVVWHEPGAGGRIMRGQGVEALPGADPAIAGGTVAWRAGDRIELAPVSTLQPAAAVAAPGAEEIAVSEGAVAWRDRDPAGHHRLFIADASGAGPARLIARAQTPDAEIGRPALDGNVIAFHITSPRSSRIVEIDFAANARRDLPAPAGTQILNPSLRGDRMLFVRAGFRRQELVLALRTAATEQVVWSTEPTARRDAGREPRRKRHRAGYPNRTPPPLPRRPAEGVTLTLWTTALRSADAFVTRLRHNRGAPTTAEILRVPLSDAGGVRAARSRWVRRR